MGRLADLQNSWKAQTWGYHDAQRLRSLRLDQEYRDSIVDQSSRVSESNLDDLDILDRNLVWKSDLAPITREQRLLGEEQVRIQRTLVSHIQGSRTRRGGEGTY